VSEEQSVQVQDQAGIQRAPVLLEQVVLGVAVAGQFLFAPVAQRRRPPVDDPLGAVGVRSLAATSLTFFGVVGLRSNLPASLAGFAPVPFRFLLFAMGHTSLRLDLQRGS
jgi:hypothetical protein